MNFKEIELNKRTKEVLRCVLVFGCLDVAGSGCERLFMWCGHGRGMGVCLGIDVDEAVSVGVGGSC